MSAELPDLNSRVYDWLHMKDATSGHRGDVGTDTEDLISHSLNCTLCRGMVLSEVVYALFFHIV